MQSPFDIIQRIATPAQRARMRSAPFAGGEVLAEVGAPVQSAIFLLAGIASAVVAIDGQAVDVGFAGRELVIGSADYPNHFVTWIARQGGQLCSMPIDDLLALKKRHRDLRDMISRGDRFLQIQAQQLAACNSKHTASVRLANFLLRTRDLYATDEFYFTQDVVAAALGLQRASVSNFASTLSDQDIISYARGRIRILDVDRLEAKACKCHRAIRHQYAHIFDSPVPIEAAQIAARASS